MNDISILTRKVIAFRDKRSWRQFHTPKDLALSLVLEACEVMEHFQWRNGAGADRYAKTHKTEIAEELADTAMYLFLLADALKVDLGKAVEVKLVKNARKYPVSKSKGKSLKYDEL